MPNYEVVGVRFNVDKIEEKKLFESLDQNNKAGSIKNVLKEHFSLNNGESLNRANIENLVKEIVQNQYPQVNRVDKIKKISSNDNNSIKINVGGKEKII